MQKQEIREAVELPLTHPDLYHQIGIDPPRGVLLYGPPGTGKTMMVKAVANNTKASFIRVVGSEVVQKYLGEVRTNRKFNPRTEKIILTIKMFLTLKKNRGIYCRAY